MKVLIQIVLHYMVIGIVFMCFYLVLSRRPTVRGVLRELFWWPHRVWKGMKVIWRSAGTGDLDA